MSKSNITKGWHEVISDIKPHVPKPWCEQQFGKRWSAIDNKEGVWCCFWAGRSMPGSYRWHFMNEQDAMLFSLRWL